MSPSACIAFPLAFSPNPSAPRTTAGSFRTTRFRKSKGCGSGHAQSGFRVFAELYAVT